LNSLAENSQVVAHVNTELSGDQGFNQNKNNQETIPIIIEAISGNKRTPIAAVSTLSGMHAGVKYRFNGKDWTDVIINDISTSNNKIEYIGRLLPLIQTFFNVIHQLKPAVISGYFSETFDFEFILGRAKILKMDNAI